MTEPGHLSYSQISSLLRRVPLPRRRAQGDFFFGGPYFFRIEAIGASGAKGMITISMATRSDKGPAETVSVALPDERNAIR